VSLVGGDEDPRAKKKGLKTKCPHCKKVGHGEEKCWQKHAELRPAWFKDKKGKKPNAGDPKAGDPKKNKGKGSFDWPDPAEDSASMLFDNCC
jgi:hypothetical protein